MQEESNILFDFQKDENEASHPSGKGILRRRVNSDLTNQINNGSRVEVL